MHAQHGMQGKSSARQCRVKQLVGGCLRLGISRHTSTCTSTCKHRRDTLAGTQTVCASCLCAENCMWTVFKVSSCVWPHHDAYKHTVAPEVGVLPVAAVAVAQWDPVARLLHTLMPDTCSCVSLRRRLPQALAGTLHSYSP